MGIPNCTKNVSNVSLHYCKSGFTWKFFNIIRKKALRPFLPFLHVSESIWSPYCEQWFLQAGSYVTRREKTHCERPFASASSMRVHVTPRPNDVISLVLQKTLKNFKFPLRDCNENDNKTIGLISKTKTLNVHYTFSTFLCRFCTTTTRKCLFFRGGHN